MAVTSRSTQLAVIGAGPGGYAAAFLAADLGLRVSLIDPEPNPGGVCLYRGCMPSKTLLHVAKVIDEAREASNWGVTFGEPTVDINKMRGFKNDVVKSLTGGLGQISKLRKIDYVRGTAKFTDASTLRVKKNDGQVEMLGFEHAIIATGSRPAVIPHLHVSSPRLLDSTSALDIEDVPKKLLVVGGGYIGLELGTVYAALGSRVTVVEMMSSLLPGADKDLVRVLHKRVENLFESILLETTVEELKDRKNGIEVSLGGKDGASDGRFDKVLVAVGRKPNSEELGLDTTNVRTNERGFIEVDAARRTAERSIFAIGDVVGEPMLAHKASHEGRTAVEVIAGKDVTFDPAAIPAVVFTDPELAWCGLTEAQAREQKREVQIAKFPWGASGRAQTLGRNDGLTKLIIDLESERVLGVGIVGPGAGELIAEGVLAVEMAARASDIKLVIHPHPTLSETIMETAEVFFGQSTHVYRPKKSRQ